MEKKDWSFTEPWSDFRETLGFRGTQIKKHRYIAMKQWFYFRDLNNNNHSQIILYINGFTVFFFYFIL